MIVMAETTCTTISNVVNQVMKTPRMFLDADSRADGKEVGRTQRRAADQPAIDVLPGKQFCGVRRLDAAAVEDAQRRGGRLVARGHLRAQRRVHLLGLR